MEREPPVSGRDRIMGTHRHGGLTATRPSRWARPRQRLSSPRLSSPRLSSLRLPRSQPRRPDRHLRTQRLRPRQATPRAPRQRQTQTRPPARRQRCRTRRPPSPSWKNSRTSSTRTSSMGRPHRQTPPRPGLWPPPQAPAEPLLHAETVPPSWITRTPHTPPEGMPAVPTAGSRHRDQPGGELPRATPAVLEWAQWCTQDIAEDHTCGCRKLGRGRLPGAMRADAESSCTESRTDCWSQDGARNPWSAPTTELWAPTGASSGAAHGAFHRVDEGGVMAHGGNDAVPEPRPHRPVCRQRPRPGHLVRGQPQVVLHHITLPDDFDPRWPLTGRPLTHSVIPVANARMSGLS